MANGYNGSGRARLVEAAQLSKHRQLKGQVAADLMSQSLEDVLVGIKPFWTPGFVIGFIAMQIQYVLIELMFAPYEAGSEDLEDYLGDLFAEKNSLQTELRAAVENLLDDLERKTGLRIEPEIKSGVFSILSEIVVLSDQEFDFVAEGKKRERNWDDLLMVENGHTGIAAQLAIRAAGRSLPLFRPVFFYIIVDNSSVDNYNISGFNEKEPPLGSWQFDDFFEEMIKPRIQGRAADVIVEVRQALNDERAIAEKEEGLPGKRDRWEVFGKHAPLKSGKRVLDKLIEDGEADSRDKLLELDPPELVQKVFGISDLARCRIVCNLNLDTERVLRCLQDGSKCLGRYKMRGSVKDFIFDPNKRDGMKGHRARQFSFDVPVRGGGSFGFEIQVMTLLQHAWDRRNHPLYERDREKHDLPVELAVNDFACSEALHLVDRQADENWLSFLDFLSAARTGKQE